jgi:hypothetical protein
MEVAWKRCEQPPVAHDEFTWEEALVKLDNAYDNYEDGRSKGYERHRSSEQQQQDNGRRLQATKASDIAMTAARWLWEDEYGCWVPMGALVGLGGREGVGKSTVCGHLVAEVTKGQLPGDFHGTPKGVVIVSTEDDWSATIKPRLVAAGADLDRVFQVKAIQPDGLEGTLSLPEDLKRLEEIIREHDVALVILDPLLTLVNKGLDTHKDAEVRRALEPVVRMAHITRASLIGLVHVNKSNEGDLLNRIMASKAMTAVPRGFLFCAKHTPVNPADDGEDPLFADAGPSRAEFVFGQIKNNLAAKIMISLQYHMETVIVGYDEEAQKDIKASKIFTDELIAENVEDIVISQEKARRGVRTRRGKAESWLVGFLVGKGEVASGWVVNAGEQAGHSRDSIHRARRNLGDRIEVVNLPASPRQTAWKLLEK